MMNIYHFVRRKTDGLYKSTGWGFTAEKHLAYVFDAGPDTDAFLTDEYDLIPLTSTETVCFDELTEALIGRNEQRVHRALEAWNKSCNPIVGNT